MTTVEKMPYGRWFTPAGSDRRLRLLDYHFQFISEDGGLCRDRPIRCEDASGQHRDVSWGTQVKPVREKGEPDDAAEDGNADAGRSQALS